MEKEVEALLMPATSVVALAAPLYSRMPVASAAISYPVISLSTAKKIPCITPDFVTSLGSH